MTAMTMARTSA